jgi:hypothetical protein
MRDMAQGRIAARCAVRTLAVHGFREAADRAPPLGVLVLIR